MAPKLTIFDIVASCGYPRSVLDRVASLLAEGHGYEIFSWQGRSGETRQVVSPEMALRNVTRNLHVTLSSSGIYVAPAHVHGFVRDRSTITNAAQHLAKPCVLRVDLKQFFASITSERIRDSLVDHMSEDAADLIIGLTTIDGRLPVGLSTSPLLSNLVFRRMDSELSAFSDTHSLTYTRYVDDLIFSGELDDATLGGITAVVESDGWCVNERKTRFMRRGGPQFVTGLYVGCADRPRLPRGLKRYLRWVAFAIEKFGYDVYMTDFEGQEREMWPRTLFGWARYCAAVDPDFGFPLLKFFTENVDDVYWTAPRF